MRSKSIYLPLRNRIVIKENTELYLLKLLCALFWIQANVTGFCRCFWRVSWISLLPCSEGMDLIMLHGSPSCCRTFSMLRKVSVPWWKPSLLLQSVPIMQWERVNNHFISTAETFCTSPGKKQLFLLWVAEVLPLEVFTLGFQMLAYIHNLCHPIVLQRSESRLMSWVWVCNCFWF